MRVAFRTDASVDIGTGHVMRCLTLADELRRRGSECMFICRPHSGHLMSQIKARGHGVLPLPERAATGEVSAHPTAHAQWLGAPWELDALDTQTVLANTEIDWLVTDHYALDYRWEQTMRPQCARLMTVDDLADRKHECDLLLDQNLGRDAADYQDLIPSNARLAIGPQHALLRPEFAELRQASLARRTDATLRSVLVTLGGVDKDNVSERVLDALDAEPQLTDLRVTVVLGPRAPWLAEVRARAMRMRAQVTVLAGVDDMAGLMAACDFAIGAAGGTAWERCCLGLPSAVFVLAPNQAAGAAALQSVGAAQLVEDAAAACDLICRFQLSSGHAEMQRMGRAASCVTDGRGAARVVDQMEDLHD